MMLPILLLMFLAMLTYWINQTVQEQTKQITGLQRHDPDYMLYDFVSTRTDAHGRTKYVLAAQEMRHFPDSNSTQLLRPRFTQFGLDKPYTQIQGQRGRVSADGHLIEFMQQVKVVRGATVDKGEMRLQTEHLAIEPDKEVAHTDQPVVIRQEPSTVITGTGMYFDKNAEIVQLFHRVHVHYERQKSATPKAKSPVKLAH